MAQLNITIEDEIMSIAKAGAALAELSLPQYITKLIEDNNKALSKLKEKNK